MRGLRSAVLKAALVGSFVVGTSPAGAVGDNTYSPPQSALVSAYQVQQTLGAAVSAHQTSVTFKYKGDVKNFEPLLDKALADALDQDSYMRYIIDRYNYSWRGSSALVRVTVTFYYRESADQTAYVNKKVKSVAKSLLKPGMNDHEKIKAIHDWVVTDLKYDQTLQKYTAYEGLVTGEAVCQGYSLLTFKLLEEAGITNMIVEGTAGGQPHAWNLVKLQNHWYHLDTTWDDPVPDQGQDVSYAYYLRTDEQMRRDHSWSKPYPAAVTSYLKTLEALKVSDKGKRTLYAGLEQELGYNLYQANQAVKDSSGLKHEVGEVIKLGKHTATIRYAGNESSLLKDLSRLYDLNIDNITYSSEPLEGTKDLKVHIEWTD